MPKKKRTWAKATKKRHVPGQMNRLEKRYSERAEADPEVIWWEFEPARLRLTIQDKMTTYTPDFMELLQSGHIRFTETKGFWTSSARVKTKVATDKFWFFIFRGAKWSKKGGWVFEEFSRPVAEEELV